MTHRATKACFPRDHQTPGENALYNKMYGASKKSGVYYSDDRRDASKFESEKPGGRVSKNTAAKWRHNLEKKGWIERINGGPRHRNPVTGMYDSIEYRVLTHAQWTAKYPGRCAAPVQSQEVPRSVADSLDHRTQSLGQAPDPIVGSGPDPNNVHHRTQSLGHKEKLKEKRERPEKTENRSHTSFDLDGQEKALTPADLTDLLIKTSIETNVETASSFRHSDKKEIESVISEASPTTDEIIFVLRQQVGKMDAWERKHAGSRIAVSLAGNLAARREAVTAERKAREGKYAANLREIAESEKAHVVWEERFAELTNRPSLEVRGSVCERGSEWWVEGVKDWVKSNPQPKRFAQLDGGLQSIVDTTVDSCIAQAVQQYNEQFAAAIHAEDAEQFIEANAKSEGGLF